MTKEEKIILSYGNYWDEFNDSSKNCALNNNGWISSILDHAPDNLDLDFKHYCYRPKELNGIEDNNGWTKIESEEDLPIENIPYDLCNIRDIEGFLREEELNILKALYLGGYITHYKKSVITKRPMY